MVFASHAFCVRVGHPNRAVRRLPSTECPLTADSESKSKPFSWRTFLLGGLVCALITGLTLPLVAKQMALTLDLNQNLQLQLDTEVPFKTHLQKKLKVSLPDKIKPRSI